MSVPDVVPTLTVSEYTRDIRRSCAARKRQDKLENRKPVPVPPEFRRKDIHDSVPVDPDQPDLVDLVVTPVGDVSTLLLPDFQSKDPAFPPLLERLRAGEAAAVTDFLGWLSEKMPYSDHLLYLEGFDAAELTPESVVRVLYPRDDLRGLTDQILSVYDKPFRRCVGGKTMTLRQAMAAYTYYEPRKMPEYKPLPTVTLSPADEAFVKKIAEAVKKLEPEPTPDFLEYEAILAADRQTDVQTQATKPWYKRLLSFCGLEFSK